MIGNDYLLKAMDHGKNVRVTLAHTTALVEEVHRRHNTSATASAAVGRVLSGALLMGSDLKGDNDILTVRVNGNGIAGPIVATVDARGTGRALISNPQADLPSKYPGKLDVGGLVGNDGYLEVIKDVGLKQPFVGRVSLVSGEIGEDLAKYFFASEQVPSLVSLGVLVAPDLSIQASGGLLIQSMPGADDEVLEKLEANVLGLGAFSSRLADAESLEDILAGVMDGLGYDILAVRDLSFKCNCGRERLGNILAGLDETEIDEIYQQEGKLEVKCNFCNEVYEFTPEEIKKIKSKKP